MLSVEGVLAEDTSDDLLLAQPQPEGIALYQSLVEQFQVWLSTRSQDYDVVSRWLDEAGVKLTKGRVLLLVGDGTASVRRTHFIHIRRQCDLRYVIDPDPEFARWVLGRGVTPMCCPHPAYSRYSFLPHTPAGAAAWDSIVSEVMGQRGVRLLDRRTEAPPPEDPEAA